MTNENITEDYLRKIKVGLRPEVEKENNEEKDRKSKEDQANKEKGNSERLYMVNLALHDLNEASLFTEEGPNSFEGSCILRWGD